MLGISGHRNALEGLRVREAKEQCVVRTKFLSRSHCAKTAWYFCHAEMCYTRAQHIGVNISVLVLKVKIVGHDVYTRLGLGKSVVTRA